MKASAGHGYDVLRNTHFGGNGEIRRLQCQFCDYAEAPMLHKRTGDRSGLPRYGRARAAMVRHLHEKHREKLS